MTASTTLPTLTVEQFLPLLLIIAAGAILTFIGVKVTVTVFGLRIDALIALAGVALIAYAALLAGGAV